MPSGAGYCFSNQELLREQYGVNAVIADCQALDTAGIRQLLADLLYAFPMGQLNIYMPRWLDALGAEHPVKKALCEALLRQAEGIKTLAQAAQQLMPLQELDFVQSFSIRDIDLATGTVSCDLSLPEKLFSLGKTCFGHPLRCRN